MSHYFDKHPDTAFVLSEIQARLRGKEYSLFVSPGVFSSKKIDKGTLLLIDAMHVKGKVLDLGCGIGVVGMVAGVEGCKVWCSDVNKRALALAKRNTKKYGVKATITQSNVYDNIKETFNVIVSNPPQHAGMEICMRIIQQASCHLVKGGSLQVVARRNKGGARFSKLMEKTFGNVTVLAKKGGYWVYKSVLE